MRFSNSDPVTGQAAWYDVRVRIRKAAPGEESTLASAGQAMPRYPGMDAVPGDLAYDAGGKRR
jgi:hypothetical protein